MEIKLKRAYDPIANDGKRVLVDRLWPRGIKKEALQLDAWIKEVAPSTALRTWFHKDRSQWAEFKKKYLQELEKTDAWKDLLKIKNLTLIYSSRDQEHNHALLLKAFLEKRRD